MSRSAALGLALLVALPAGAWAREAKTKVEGTVNLNSATADQLDLLPTVGKKAAEAIIAFRAKQPFKRVEELVKVKGFGKKRFEKMRLHLAVSGETTIRRIAPGAAAAARLRRPAGGR